MVLVWGNRLENRFLRPFPTGCYGLFSSSVPCSFVLGQVSCCFRSLRPSLSFRPVVGFVSSFFLNCLLQCHAGLLLRNCCVCFLLFDLHVQPRLICFSILHALLRAVPYCCGLCDEEQGHSLLLSYEVRSFFIAAAWQCWLLCFLLLPQCPCVAMSKYHQFYTRTLRVHTIL